MGDLNNNEPRIASKQQRELIKKLQQHLQEDTSVEYLFVSSFLTCAIAALPSIRFPYLDNLELYSAFLETIISKEQATQDRVEFSAEVIQGVLTLVLFSCSITPLLTHLISKMLPVIDFARFNTSDYFIDPDDTTLSFEAAAKRIEILYAYMGKMHHLHSSIGNILTISPTVMSLGVVAMQSRWVNYYWGKFCLGNCVATSVDSAFRQRGTNYPENRAVVVYHQAILNVIDVGLQEINKPELEFHWKLAAQEVAINAVKLELQFNPKSKDAAEVARFFKYVASNCRKNNLTVCHDNVEKFILQINEYDLSAIHKLHNNLQQEWPKHLQAIKQQQLADAKQREAAKQNVKPVTDADRIAEAARKQKEAEALQKSQEAYAKYAQEENERKQKEQEIQAAKDKQTLENAARSEAKLKAVMEEEKRRKKNAKRK